MRLLSVSRLLGSEGKEKINETINFIYRITGYLCDPESYVFWPKKAILKCM